MATTIKPGIVTDTLKSLTLQSAQNPNMTDIIKYAGAFGTLIITGIAIYSASTDDKAVTDNFFKYMVMIIIPVLIGAYLILPIFNQRANTPTLLMNVFIFMLMIISLYLYYNTRNPASVVLVKYGLYAIGGLSIVILFAILYKIGIRYIHNSRGWFSVLLQIVFFIPCLLLEFVEYVKYELGIVPNTVYVLIAIEIIILLFYIIIPKAISMYSASKHNIILNEPVFLNQKMQIADSKILSLGDVNENSFLEKEYRKNYSISFWTYFNVNSNVPTTIFRIGNTNDERQGKPMVSYSNGKCQFYFTNNNHTPYEITIPLQKWNYFVITYNDNKVELFINGNLEKTFDIVTPTYYEGDVIEVGNNSKQKGVLGYDYNKNTGNVSGAICNVSYHKTPMTQFQIITEYNLLMFTNPPLG